MPKLPKTPPGWFSSDVAWYGRPKVKGKKPKAIAYSTIATADTIAQLVKEGYNTPNKILEAGKAGEFILFQEVEMVCAMYWLEGYGNKVWKYDDRTGRLYG